EKMFKEKNWGLLIDKNTPGVLCVNNAIDKTKDVLKLIDQDYDKTTEKKSAAKATNNKEKPSIQLT
ncbi:MAG: hypothetical protein V1855_05120, partial [bacterium]